ncbi:MAG: hypothetical protein GY705_25360 [Bacteroidetes bacterium]|nr:hypothetical protein [Bacteroidota bacterium]
MIQEFEGLTIEEQKELVDTIPLVTILIAGADNDIDSKETAWAKKVTEIRAYNYPLNLQAYYEMVSLKFDERMEALLKELPENVSLRNIEINNKLEKLNNILPKMEDPYGKIFYNGLLSFANHVAKASGGFMGFGSVAVEEKKLLKLSMIKPV